MFFSFRRKLNVSGATKTNTSSIVYNAAASSDVGAVRKNNEDKVLFVKPHDEVILINRGCLGIVADGMGGHNGGEIASQMAVDLISKFYYESKIDIEKALKKSFIKANELIHNTSQKNKIKKGMGTTCTAVVIHGKDLYLAHVGDSRAYLVNNTKITKLTTDHTYVQSLLDNGLIDEHEVNNHPERNVITKCLGTQKTVTPDLKHYKNLLTEEDLIFLCSDGLYEYIQEEELRIILNSNTISEAADMLISKARERGGHDNISVLIIEQESKNPQETTQVTQEIL